MSQDDWIGGTTGPRKPFRDIRSTRDSVASRKAELCLALGALINRPPNFLASASINKTREWVAVRNTAAKVCKNPRSSVTELEIAISSLRRFESL